jgi:hypothetical protein
MMKRFYSSITGRVFPSEAQRSMSDFAALNKVNAPHRGVSPINPIKTGGQMPQPPPAPLPYKQTGGMPLPPPRINTFQPAVGQYPKSGSGGVFILLLIIGVGAFFVFRQFPSSGQSSSSARQQSSADASGAADNPALDNAKRAEAATWKELVALEIQAPSNPQLEPEIQSLKRQLVQERNAVANSQQPSISP